MVICSCRNCNNETNQPKKERSKFHISSIPNRELPNPTVLDFYKKIPKEINPVKLSNSEKNFTINSISKESTNNFLKYIKINFDSFLSVINSKNNETNDISDFITQNKSTTLAINEKKENINFETSILLTFSDNVTASKKNEIIPININIKLPEYLLQGQYISKFCY